MTKKLRPYIFAGLDFMVDKDNNIVFLEANSNPGLMMVYKTLYGKYEPVEKFIDALKDEKQIIFLYSQEYIESRNYGYTFGAFRFALGKRCRQVILTKKQMKNFSLPLKDIKGNVITSGTVWNSRLNVKRALSKNKNFRILNSAEVAAATIDKWETHQAVKHLRGVKVPKTFIFSTKNELLNIVEKYNLKKVIIKPRRGTEGKGIILVNSKKQLERIQLSQKEFLVQEKIELQKDKNKFWCMRAFVVNGKYVGAMKLLSKNSVVNVSRGAKTEKVEKKLQKKLAPIAEKCVRAIEAYAKKKDRLD